LKSRNREVGIHHRLKQEVYYSLWLFIMPIFRYSKDLETPNLLGPLERYDVDWTCEPSHLKTGTHPVYETMYSLEYLMMEVQNPRYPECHTPSSEHVRICASVSSKSTRTSKSTTGRRHFLEPRNLVAYTHMVVIPLLCHVRITSRTAPTLPDTCRSVCIKCMYQ
jgi:hypothetical protein